MNIISDMRERVDRLASAAELDVEAAELLVHAMRLSDESVVELMGDLAELSNDVGRLQSVLAGVTVQRSRRDAGHSGLAATKGHATPAGLIQSLTGGSRADANRHVRVGSSLFETSGEPDAPDSDEVDATEPDGTDATEPDAGAPSSAPTVWHEPLRQALFDGRVNAAQHDVIRRGLGEPPADGEDAEAVLQAWSLAAAGLVDDAETMQIEDLASRARTTRDLLDPTGAEERFAKRYESRSFRMWIDQDGQHRARVAFDDEMAQWVKALRAAALRPRRGGPRFMTDEERARADELRDDERTNEQLEYDLFMDMLRTGALARAEDVFGARQPGVRMVVVKDATGPRDAFGRLLAVGHAEDGGDALPGTVLDRAQCTNGSVDVTVDSRGNPLDVGREQRLFTPKQRLALAIRDGGCLWPGCGRPASYCEAHHADEWASQNGRTDIDRGVLLCRHHHMLLHNRAWRITRDGHGPFVLHPPPGEGPPIRLDSKAAWKWAWDPPPPLERSHWRAA